MTEITFCLSRAEFAQQFTALPGHEAWGALQTGNGRIAAESPLARVHRHGGSDDHEPAFTLTSPTEPAHTLCTVAPQAGAAARQTVYAVHDGYGRFIGQVTHERSPRGSRQAWRIEDADRQCSVTAYKGNIRGWIAYWAFSPFWAILALLNLLNGDTHSSWWLWGKPRRAHWHTRSGDRPRKPALDFKSGRYRADTGLLDANLVYAQAALYGA
ncbi:hypothetical protein RM550_30175 [Streptomyces sp. DSM 41527]|uniref:Uncharacterized protein n=1 Tax=Streptomyces mooreae TaxID=3075523 RepID=A0ABU2TGB4_9ACTN|nr:hypothetical protein [Streptomyces sp. DSM 41527]MDT0459942.1 hypothetical protein [Streptomyces sp. DSM 41527]